MTIPQEAAAASSIDIELADPRLALCLSGGGFRAALFHLGALRRLNELGILSQIDTISSVSGGSILAAHLATQVQPWPPAGRPFDPWEQKVEASFRRFVGKNLCTGPLLKRFLFPWNWFGPSTQVKALEGCYQRHLTDRLLPDLPQKPTFVLCATGHGLRSVVGLRAAPRGQLPSGISAACSELAAGESSRRFVVLPSCVQSDADGSRASADGGGRNRQAVASVDRNERERRRPV